MPSDWKMTSGAVTTNSVTGVEFSIEVITDSPTMQSNFYVFFALIECTIKAAPGVGIVSSFILESDDLDEIDIEIIGSSTNQAQSNYFGKGNTTTYDRGQMHNVATPEATYHKYAVDWKSDTTTWLIDDVVVRTLNYGDAVGGKNYPQTPMTIKLGTWVAGQSSNSPGTVQWAGGLANMAQAPFTMFVETCTITNYNPAVSFIFGDMSGSNSSIQVKKSITDPAPSINLSSELGLATSLKSSTTIKSTTTVSTIKTTSSTSLKTTSSTSLKTTSTSSLTKVSAVVTSSTKTTSLMSTTSHASTVTVKVLNTTSSITQATLKINTTALTATASKPAMVTTNAAVTNRAYGSGLLGFVVAVLALFT
jgi:beta-glucanase (GH16 family)